MRLIVLTLMFFTILSYAQIDNNSLIVTPSATTTELDAITTPLPKLGSIAFDTTKDRLVEYTTDGWKEILTQSNVYVGSFIINAPTGTVDTSFDVEVNGIPFKPSQVTFVTHVNVETLTVDDTSSDGLNSATLQNAFGTCNGFARQETSGIVQSTIYIGGSGSSINGISRYSSGIQCFGLRYSNQNGEDMGKITGDLSEFGAIDVEGYNGFTINVSYSLGVSGNVNRDNDIMDESLVVLYTAYR